MILANLTFVLFALLAAIGAGWVAYLAKARPGPAIAAALVTLLAFAGLALALIALLRGNIAA